MIIYISTEETSEQCHDITVATTSHQQGFFLAVLVYSSQPNEAGQTLLTLKPAPAETEQKVQKVKCDRNASMFSKFKTLTCLLFAVYWERFSYSLQVQKHFCHSFNKQIALVPYIARQRNVL